MRGFKKKIEKNGHIFLGTPISFSERPLKLYEQFGYKFFRRSQFLKKKAKSDAFGNVLESFDQKLRFFGAHDRLNFTAHMKYLPLK